MRTAIDNDMAAKNKTIESLKSRIDELSTDFAKMLTETLDNMRGKVQAANAKWQSESEGTQNMMQQRLHDNPN